MSRLTIIHTLEKFVAIGAHAKTGKPRWATVIVLHAAHRPD
jgi:hypothetical protein